MARDCPSKHHFVESRGHSQLEVRIPSKLCLSDRFIAEQCRSNTKYTRATLLGTNAGHTVVRDLPLSMTTVRQKARSCSIQDYKSHLNTHSDLPSLIKSPNGLPSKPIVAEILPSTSNPHTGSGSSLHYWGHPHHLLLIPLPIFRNTMLNILNCGISSKKFTKPQLSLRRTRRTINPSAAKAATEGGDEEESGDGL